MAAEKARAGEARHAATELDPRNRLLIPREVWRAAASFKDHSGDVLAVFDEPGLVRLLPLGGWPEKIEALRRRFEQTSDIEALMTLSDRYRIIQVSAEHRIQMSNEMLLHLKLAASPDRWVYVETLGADIQIASVEYRDARLLRISKRIAELP